MNKKILVADDSKTIQKVVTITLSTQSYDCVEANNEQELMDSLLDSDLSLILLDFGLSEEKNGLELIKLVKSKTEVPILALMGTFDSIDESALFNAGISDFVIKPFESEVFSQKCSSLLENPKKILDRTGHDSLSDPEEAEEEQWVTNSPAPENFTEKDLAAESDVLNEELHSWSVIVPDVIGHKESEKREKPPIISERKNEDLLATDQSENEEVSYPEDNDLEYPDLNEEIDLEMDIGSKLDELSHVKLSDKLTSMDELTPEVDSFPEREVEKETSTSLAHEVDFTSLKELELESEVRDEVSSADFWAVDEGLAVEFSVEEEAEVVAEAEVEVGSEIVLEAEAEVEVEVEAEVKREKLSDEFSQEKIVKEIQEAMKPMLEEMVKKYCQESIMKVAWEIIPDLAENIIKKEVSEISRSFKN